VDRGDHRGDLAEHLVADGDGADALADLLDHAGEVAPEGDGVLVREHPREHPGGDAAVELVDRRRLHPDEHLAGARRAGFVDVLKRRAGAFLSNGDGLHGVSDRWGSCSCGRTRTVTYRCVSSTIRRW
jgi:hypothetical protein